ncbi:DUF397 domain-containing protein [Streptomyces sp. NPDC056160]|uniref:DUF397 domain-containing protein n=1 Tax=Streptomyces sp. NPDC056160 TaxID=3345731 RepID=UPI0035D65631
MPVGTRPVSASAWFKSSYSGGNATECVECAYTSQSVLIRDSKQVEGAILRVRPEVWWLFVRDLA